LETWARPIQLRKNTETYDLVRRIFRDRSFNGSSDFEIYLQGSVANKTNILANGDIDIVFQFNGVFKYHYPYPHNVYNRPSAYTLQQLKDGMKSAVKKCGVDYEEGRKSIKLFRRSRNYQDVDLIPAFQYRDHYGRGKKDYREGIMIQTSQGASIFSYPKLHKSNGELKNRQTGNYKKMVRIFKNIKSRLVDDGMDANLAPSYFVECLVYNIPNKQFRCNNLGSSVCNCLNWLNSNENNLSSLRCQNGVTYLFGNDSAAWNVNDCKGFIKKATQYATRPR